MLSVKFVKKFICVSAAACMLSGCLGRSAGDISDMKEVQKVSSPPELQSFSPAPDISGFSAPAEEVTEEAALPKSSGGVSGTENYVPLNYKVQKGVWLSYIDIAEMLEKKTENQFRENIAEAFDNIRGSGFNTVYVHVRPFGDALYDSKIYAPSRYFTGTAGENSGFDPLEIMVEEGHKKGLSVHAWINPLRCEKAENIEKAGDGYQIGKWYFSEEYMGKYLVADQSDGRLWLDPAYPEVRELICSGVGEICENYRVDGIHIDDYFYPTADESFDRQAFSQSMRTSVADFRLENINMLVSEMYRTVKAANRDMLFGISPQGNVNNNYTQLFADVKRWAGEKGYCDYIAPQVYYGFENKVQPFEQVIKEWDGFCGEDVKLVIGLAFYKVGGEEEFTENKGIISQQIECCKKLENYSGVAVYNYKSIFPGDEQASERAKEELEMVRQSLND